MPRLARAHAPLTRFALEILEDREVPALVSIPALEPVA